MPNSRSTAAIRWAASIALYVVVSLLPRSAAEPTTKVFEYTGSEDVFIVPADVTFIEARVWGPAGGGGVGEGEEHVGGGGGFARAFFEVEPNDVLIVIVGQGGGLSTDSTQPRAFQKGGRPGLRTGYQMGGGGGRSAVVRDGLELLVAGGGGGAGCTGWGLAAPLNGGGGGGPVGLDGLYSRDACSGTGGNQTAGGAPLCNTVRQDNGNDVGGKNLGGSGGMYNDEDPSKNTGNCGGGGGDGYYGGGAGVLHAGGGGGSGFLDPTINGYMRTGSTDSGASAGADEPGYVAGVGQGQKGANGGHGQITFVYEAGSTLPPDQTPWPQAIQPTPQPAEETPEPSTVAPTEEPTDEPMTEAPVEPTDSPASLDPSPEPTPAPGGDIETPSPLSPTHAPITSAPTDEPASTDTPETESPDTADPMPDTLEPASVSPITPTTIAPQTPVPTPVPPPINGTPVVAPPGNNSLTLFGLDLASALDIGEGVFMGSTLLFGFTSGPVLGLVGMRALLLNPGRICVVLYNQTLVFAENPTQVSLGESSLRYYVASASLAPVLVTGAIVLHILVTLVAKVKGGVSFARAAENVRFPAGTATVPATLLQQAVCNAFIVALGDPEFWANFLSIWTLGMILLILAVVVKNLAVSFRAEGRITSQDDALPRFCQRNEEWVDNTNADRGNRGFVAMYGMLFFSFRPGRQWYLIVEFIVSVVVGALAGIRPGWGEDCHMQVAVPIAVILLLVGLCGQVVSNPFNTLYDRVWYIVLAGVIGAGSLFTALSVAEEPEVWAIDATQYAEMAALCLGMLKGLLDVVLFLYRVKHRDVDTDRDAPLLADQEMLSTSAKTFTPLQEASAEKGAEKSGGNTKDFVLAMEDGAHTYSPPSSVAKTTIDRGYNAKAEAESILKDKRVNKDFDPVQASIDAGEWVPAVDEKTGRTYYYDPKTMKVTWDLRKELGLPPKESAPQRTATVDAAPSQSRVAFEDEDSLSEKEAEWDRQRAVPPQRAAVAKQGPTTSYPEEEEEEATYARPIARRSSLADDDMIPLARRGSAINLKSSRSQLSRVPMKRGHKASPTAAKEAAEEDDIFGDVVDDAVPYDESSPFGDDAHADGHDGGSGHSKKHRKDKKKKKARHVDYDPDIL